MAGKVPQDKELPLAGTILCCTSIVSEKRAELAAIARQMGATHKFDLTSDVTHLIVGETNTPKYKFVAKARSDVVVVKPEWVNAVRESWMEGGDTDLQWLEDQYKFPIFGGLSICVTGFDDLDFRDHLKRTITTHGGEFRDDLTKSVTHLISRNTRGQKYQFAVEWGIRVVSLKWFHESLERGMVLEEELYSPLKPTDEQGIGAWNRSLPETRGKRPKAVEPAARRPRKLRRTASTKLLDQTEGIWTDIVGRNYEPANPPEQEKDEWSTDIQPQAAAEPPNKASKSFSSETPSGETIDLVTQDPTQDVSQAAPDRSRNLGLLFGCRFFIHGFSAKKVPVLQNHLISNGAEISPSLDELSPLSSLGPIKEMYIAVPYDMPRSKLPMTDHLGFDPEIVTDMWIERCLSTRKLVPPEAHITSTPFPKFPIPAFQGLRICSTGFANIDLLHVSKLVKLMGATYDEYLTADASVLICNTPNPSVEKLRHVYEWKIPAVNADWLWISVQTGEKKPFDPYIIPNAQLSRKSESSATSKQRQVHQKERRSHREGRDEKAQISNDGPNPIHKTDARQPPEDINKESNKTNTHQSPPAEDLTGNYVSGNDSYPDDRPRPPTEPSVEPAVAVPEKAQSNSPQKSLPSPARSHSAPKDPENKPAPQPSRKEANSTTSSGPLGAAISELLKQKRQGPRNPTDNPVGPDGRRTSKRRPLLGRANSLTTGRTVTTIGPGGHSNGISRAGSIDSLNDDGSGSVIGSVIDETDNQSNHGKSNAQSFCSVLTANSGLENNSLNRYHRQPTDPYYDDGTGLGESEGLHMTQLGYEDPDAAAMREKITRQSGGATEGAGSGAAKGQKKKAGVVLGEVRDLEPSGSGWGGGRRSRRAARGSAVEDGL
ncbi:hypothetical protein FQN54_006362 [Arachnomyces sp. PD_36]|nr:hypothetical protein FQN54_006362 [Arachnomyces sp. PD_36]